MRIGLGAVAVLLAVFAGCGAEGRKERVTWEGNAGEERVHVEQAGGKLLTDQVRINGRSVGWFIIDTGANVTFVDESVLEKAGIGEGDRRTRDGAAGSKSGSYRVRSLSFGGGWCGTGRWW